MPVASNLQVNSNPGRKEETKIAEEKEKISAKSSSTSKPTPGNSDNRLIKNNKDDTGIMLSTSSS